MYPLATKAGFRHGKAVGILALVLALALIAYVSLVRHDTPLTKAVGLIRSGKAAAALPYLEDMLRQHPDDASVFPWLAQAYLSTERLGEGRTALDTALKVRRPDEDVVPVVLAYASYYQSRGDFAEAEKLFDSADSLYKSDKLASARAELYIRWAESEYANDRLPQAVARLESLLSGPAAEPVRERAAHRLCDYYRELAAIAELKDKDDRRAVSLLEKSLGIADEPATRMALAGLYVRTGQAANAVSAYEAVCRADLNNLEARHRLIDLLIESRNFRRAQEALLELTDRERSVENYQLLASVNLKLGNYSGAVRALEDASDLRPKEPAILRQLGSVLSEWSEVLSRQGKVQESQSVLGHADRVRDMLSMLVKKGEDDKEAPPKATSEPAGLPGEKSEPPPWNPNVPPIALCSSRIWLSKGSLTPEGEIQIRNITGRPVSELSLTVVFYDNTARARKGTVTLPVAGPTSPPFPPGAVRSLYFSCPNIVKPDHHLAVIIFWKGRLLKELPCVKK